MTNQNKLGTLGTRIFVDFPKIGLTHIPAKVDTGADVSSIWASHIHEREGKLLFTLFSQVSPFYTGEVISTRDYTVRSIKNSFGITEFRYKVKLQVRIENKLINASFTLADRSNNSSSVLIGRKALAGKFLVDVSQTITKDKLSILVLRTKGVNPDDPTAELFKTISAKNKSLKFTISEFEDLVFKFDDAGTKITIGKDGPDIAKFDLVYFKAINNNKDRAASAATYLQKRQVPFVDKAVAGYSQSINKLIQYIILKDAGVKIPNSIFLPANQIDGAYKELKSYFGTPFVLKDIRGKRGKNKFLVRDEAAFKFAISKTKEREFEVIAQEYIPHKGHYRVLVIGRQARLLVFQEHSFSSSRQNNPDVKNPAKLMELRTIPLPVQQMAIDSANILQLDIAGVDVLQDERTGEWYVLEVNDGPQLATGSFLDEKRKALTQYIVNKYQKNYPEA